MSPDLAAILLGLFSAVTLAAANLSVKLGGDILVARALLSLSAAILILPLVLLAPPPDAATFRALAFALPAHFAYQLCLVRALQHADLSLVFPVMRGASPLLTALAAMLLLGEMLPPVGWVGLVVATMALGLVALPPRQIRLRDHPDARPLAWAVATAVGIALYNVADARGVRAAPSPFTYIAWLFLLDAVPITIAAVAARGAELRAALAGKWRYGAAAGLLSILSFGAALYAFSLVETVKVAALRETSVVFAAMFGALFLGERFGRRRIVGALILAAGLALLQLAR